MGGTFAVPLPQPQVEAGPRPYPVRTGTYGSPRPGGGKGRVPRQGRHRKPRRQRQDRRSTAPSNRRGQVAMAGRLLMTAGLVAGLLFTVGVRHAAVSSLGYRLVEMEAHLEDLEAHRDALQAQVGGLNAAGRVEEAATAILGMSRPVDTRVARAKPLSLVSHDQPRGRAVTVHLPEREDGGAVAVAAEAGWMDRATGWLYSWLSGTRAEARSHR